MKLRKPRLTAKGAAPLVSTRKATAPISSTQQHREWRAAVLRRAGGRCQHPGCGKRGKLYADHITELRDGGAPFDVNNGQALCASHHTAKTARERARRLQRRAGE